MNRNHNPNRKEYLYFSSIFIFFPVCLKKAQTFMFFALLETVCHEQEDVMLFLFPYILSIYIFTYGQSLFLFWCIFYFCFSKLRLSFFFGFRLESFSYFDVFFFYFCFFQFRLESIAHEICFVQSSFPVLMFFLFLFFPSPVRVHRATNFFNIIKVPKL